MYIMKKAIVTGGESGIGKGIVKALSKEGYEIVSSYYYEKELADEVKKEIEAEGGKITFFKADFSENDTPHEFFNAAVSHFEGLDLLVNNAAASIPESLQDLKDEHIIAARQESALTEMFALRPGEGEPISKEALYEYWEEISNAIKNVSSNNPVRALGRLLHSEE